MMTTEYASIKMTDENLNSYSSNAANCNKHQVSESMDCEDDNSENLPTQSFVVTFEEGKQKEKRRNKGSGGNLQDAFLKFRLKRQVRTYFTFI